MANFSRQTRYTNGQKDTTRSGKEFLVLRSALKLQKAVDDTYIKLDLSLVDRPDLVSQKAYNRSDLWWAIYEYNDIKDPFFDPIPGQILRIPSLSRLLAAIEKLGLEL